MNNLKISTKFIKLIPLIFFGIIFLIIIATYFIIGAVYSNEIFPNPIFGNQKIDEIEGAINIKLDEANSQRLVIVSEEFSRSYVLKELGIEFDKEETVKNFKLFGRGNNVLRNLFQRIQSVMGFSSVKVAYQKNDRFKKTISDIEEQIHQDAQEATIVIEGVVAKATDSINGRKLNSDLFEQIIDLQMSNLDLSPIELPISRYSPALDKTISEVTIQKINENLNIPYILRSDDRDIVLGPDKLWEWIEVDTEDNVFVVRLDEDKLSQYFKQLESQINKPMQNATLEIKDDRAIKFVPHQLGAVLRIKDAVKLIQSTLLSLEREIELPINYLKPKIQLSDLNQLGIEELVASGSSSFKGSPINRRHNIATGTARFDGVLIPPQTTFSFNEALGEVDAATGYLPELVIKGDETVPEYGGGLCQVSTTAFRAILNGGYPIDARKNHAYRVSYYEPAGSDATIYPPYPDLKFTNNSPGHILMHAYIEGDTLYFDFYGTKTNYKVELEGPEIYNITDYPEPVYIETSTIPEGEVKQIEVAHRGADTILYRYIYDENGKQIQKDEFRSHYIPWPAKYLVGIKEAPEVEADLKNVLPGSSGSEEPEINLKEE